MLKESWQLFKDNLVPVMVAFLGMAIIQFAGSQILEALEGSVLMFFVWLVVMGLNVITSMLWLYAVLLIVKGKKLSFEAVMKSFTRFMPYLVGSLLFGCLVLLGVILLIVPGIYWALKYMFLPYLIIDKNMQPSEAFRRSAEMTEGIKGQLLVLLLIAALINVAGALAFGIGLLITAPVTSLASALLYEKIQSKE